MSLGFARFRVRCLIFSLLLTAVSVRAADFTSEGIEFFEKKIRPVLVDRCYKCHSAGSEKLKGGLHLDSRDGMLKGGDTRASIVPGDPEKSLLVEAIRYRNSDLQMPPKGKLSDEQVAAFTDWIKMGAPWPQEAASKEASKVPAFDLEKRRSEHWSWKLIQPQKLPRVKNAKWPSGPTDHFILARLEEKNLSPAAPADLRSLIRRLYFDLIGLPPSPQEVDAFLNDKSSGAYEKVVDQLLASPQFGERWARHWLDLVRYAETLGHEFDYPNHNAWRYRDYLIRAFNADLPYDKFVTEHIAGDLLAKPRRHPAEGFNESVIGTSFFWMGQREHSPVDVRQNQAEIVDNQIDVMTKTFLGLTVACARCHDHKFDAIPTKDFYSFFGVLGSSRYTQRAIDAPERVRPKVEQLKTLKREVRQELPKVWARNAAQMEQYLLSATAVRHQTNSKPTPEALQEKIKQAAIASNLNAEMLSRWVKALQDKSVAQPNHPLALWEKLANDKAISSPEQFKGRWQALTQELKSKAAKSQNSGTNYEMFADFRGADYAGWFADGDAFGAAPSPAGDILIGAGSAGNVTLLTEPAAHSAAVSTRLQGALRSPSFTINRRYILILAAGRETRINVCVDNFTVIRDPIYGGLRKRLNDDVPRWIVVDAEMWKGHRAYLEFNDTTTPDPGEDGKKSGSGNGYLAVSRVVFSDLREPPALGNTLAALAALGDAPVDSMEALAKRYQRAAIDGVEAWASGRFDKAPSGGAPLDLLGWLTENRLLEDGVSSAATDRLSKLFKEYRDIEASIPEPTMALAMTDGNGVDEHVFIRGSYKNAGEIAPRRFLTAIGGAQQSPFKNGSGRLELAQQMTDASNPFVSRVMVNRVWLHLFGRGIVPTPDDFGVLGQPPTHPELLDWLAGWYRHEGGWSTKKLIRLLVTSSAYRMSSKPLDAVAEEKDPSNLFLHRMPVRRLEGEAIRDAILAVSGRLDKTMFGQPVATHLTEFMEGRGRPGASGPLDGAGRRSIYLEVRRNFLSPMMRTFDTPVPFTTVGKRTISNVPAQSLILLNDPFVLGQAQLLAKKVCAKIELSPAQRVSEIYLAAYSRPPAEAELTAALAFVKEQGEAYGASLAERPREEKVWADFCHVILNVKEFVFIN